MKSFLKRYWKWITAPLIFVVLVLFFSPVRLPDLMRSRASLRRLEREVEYYRAQIKADSIFLENLKDDDFLEKYAREKFYMHAKDEQVFLFEQDNITDLK